MKKIIRKYLPEEKIRNHKYLRIFGGVVHSPNLWHINRRSLARAVAIGLFSCFIPIPFQMMLAATLAILFNANLPVSVVLVWLSNPITIPPMLYFTYKIGGLFIHPDAHPLQLQPSWQWVEAALAHYWPPILLGCFICAVFFSSSGYLLTRVVWRVWVIRKRKRGNRGQ